jgi:hypothetical protein
MASGVVGNLVAEKAIPYRWIYLAYILVIITLGIGFHGYVTFTIPRNKKLSNWVKSVIFRTPEINEKPLKHRGKYKLRKRKIV